MNVTQKAKRDLAAIYKRYEPSHPDYRHLNPTMKSHPIISLRSGHLILFQSREQCNSCSASRLFKCAS